MAYRGTNVFGIRPVKEQAQAATPSPAFVSESSPTKEMQNGAIAPAPKLGVTMPGTTMGGMATQASSGGAPTTLLQADIQMENGYPKAPGFETMFDPTGKFKYALNKQNFDVVTPWKTLADQEVQKGYQSALGANVAGQATGQKMATEGLAMEGGLSPRQMARLADRSLQNKLMNDQLAYQQKEANQLNVNLLGENMKKTQEQYLGQEGLKTDIANQGASINSVQDLNQFINNLVTDLMKKQMGVDMGASL